MRLDRLLWACICAVVWPIYYAGVFLEWAVSPLPELFMSDDRSWNYEFSMYDRVRNPPFRDRFRKPRR